VLLRSLIQNQSSLTVCYISFSRKTQKCMNCIFYHKVCQLTEVTPYKRHLSLPISQGNCLPTALLGIITVLLLHPQVIKMSLTFSKFLQFSKALLGTVTVLLLMSSRDKDKTLPRFLILKHEWVIKCPIKVDVPTLILVYWPKIFYWRWGECMSSSCLLQLRYCNTLSPLSVRMFGSVS